MSRKRKVARDQKMALVRADHEKTQQQALSLLEELKKIPLDYGKPIVILSWLQPAQIEPDIWDAIDKIAGAIGQPFHWVQPDYLDYIADLKKEQNQ